MLFVLCSQFEGDGGFAMLAMCSKLNVLLLFLVFSNFFGAMTGLDQFAVIFLGRIFPKQSPFDFLSKCSVLQVFYRPDPKKFLSPNH